MPYTYGQFYATRIMSNVCIIVISRTLTSHKPVNRETHYMYMKLRTSVKYTSRHK